MHIARRYTVSGRVQGVGYRWFATRAAERCGVSGTAENLADGSVEVVGQGTAEALAAFRSELERGPRAGRVERVVEEPAPPVAHSGFRILG